MNEILATLDLNGWAMLGHIVNILILVVAFKYFIGDYVVKEIHKKRALIKKLENAETHYDEMIDKAKTETQKLLKEGRDKKQALIAEAWSIGDKKKSELIEEGNRKAQGIVDNAQVKADNMQSNMEKEFETAVKSVSIATVTKLFWEDKKLKDEYVSKLVQEVK